VTSRRIRSIQRRLFRAALAGLVAVTALATVSLLAARNSLRDDAKRELRTLAQLQRMHVDHEVSNLHEHVLGLAADPALSGFADELLRRPSGSNADVARRLGELSAKAPSVVAASLYDREGTLIADSSGAGASHVPSVIPTDFMSAASAATLQTDMPSPSRAFAAGSGGRYFDVASVRSADGKIIAVMFAEVSLDTIDAIVPLGAAGRRTLDTHLVQRSGETAEFVTDLRFKPGARFTLHLPLSRVDMPGVRAAMGKTGIVENSTDYRNHKVIAYTEPLEHAPWSLVVKVDQSEAYGLIGHIGAILVGSLVGSMALLGLGYVALSRSLVGRIRRLTASATAISRGALTTRVGDPSDDELGQLGRAFDRMADTLARDIARRERVEAELAHRALHDFLTDLPNRSLFAEHLHNAIERRRIDGGELAVLFVDLDEFKTVNDELGHTAGDSLLRAVVDRFRRVLTPNEILARFGGDEFVVLCAGLASSGDADVGRVADRLLESLQAPLQVAGMDVFVTASIGIAAVDDDATPESLVRDADAAMYRAKSQGRGRRVMHEAGSRTTSLTQLSAMTELRRAVDSQAFSMVYQPIVSILDGRLFGYEALARWPRADGVAMPEDFIPLIAELDLSASLDQWAVLTACRALPTIELIGPAAPLFVSVNVSTPTLLVPGFLERILNEVHTLYRSGRSLCLEITEREMAEVSASSLSVLTTLRAAGVRVSVDDFGTGASSLARLRQLPVDVLKIDRHFVEDIDTDAAARSMCSAVVAMGNDLGMHVVAEGVEREAQLAVLREIGCHGGQGYLFGRPSMLPPARDARRSSSPSR
jgi:diguanylate cyclase (GGDEF)-like protein